MTGARGSWLWTTVVEVWVVVVTIAALLTLLLWLWLGPKVARMDAAAWAAWVQAIGSILAIVFAVFLSSGQARRDEKRTLEADARSVRSFAALTDSAKEAVHRAAFIIHGDSGFTNDGLLTTDLDGVAARRRACEAFPLQGMPVDQLRIAVEVLEELRDCHLAMTELIEWHRDRRAGKHDGRGRQGVLLHEKMMRAETRLLELSQQLNDFVG